MIQEEIKNANMLIAEFMGMKQGVIITQPNGDGIGYYNPDELEYNSSWGWLIPVVEKISNYKYDDGDTAYLRTFGMIDQGGQIMVRINRCPLFTNDTLIEATYAAVIDFITWSKQPTQ